jgi:hypothetical protein
LRLWFSTAAWFCFERAEGRGGVLDSLLAGSVRALTAADARLAVDRVLFSKGLCSMQMAVDLELRLLEYSEFHFLAGAWLPVSMGSQSLVESKSMISHAVACSRFLEPVCGEKNWES